MPEIQRDNINRLPLADEARELARSEVIGRGLFYIVPLSKYGYYEDGKPPSVEVGPATFAYFEPFLVDGAIGVDLEDVFPVLLDPADVGMDGERRVEAERGISNHIAISQKFARNSEIFRLLGENLSPQDMERLEFDSFDPRHDYLAPGVLIRADLLLKEDGDVLCCDPNLVPLGFSITHQIAASLTRHSGIDLVPPDDYLNQLVSLSLQNQNRVSGVVTGLDYPNWPSHLALAEMVREKYDVPFFMIPSHCMKDGRLDMAELGEFNRAFGIFDSFPGEDIPGSIVRYSREVNTFHPETNVIYKPGIRVVETQLWKGFVFLPGVEGLAAQCGVSMAELTSARRVVVPTLIMRRVGENLEVCTGITRRGGDLAFVWEDAESRIDLFEQTLDTNGARNGSEKDNELSWFVKTPSTSGKKGVRFTNDGRCEKAPKNILKAVQRFDQPDGAVFMVQPKVRSTLKIGDNEEFRTKIDHYLLPGGKTLLLDAMVTPLNQRSAHGSAATRLAFVRKE